MNGATHQRGAVGRLSERRDAVEAQVVGARRHVGTQICGRRQGMKLRGVVRWRVLVGQVVRVMWLHEGGAARVHVTWRCTRTSAYQYEYMRTGVHTGTSARAQCCCFFFVENVNKNLRFV